MKTDYWYCDVCKEKIVKPDDGWLQWIEFDVSEGQRAGRDLQLVHHRPASSRSEGCQFKQKLEYSHDRGIVNDGVLTHYLGDNGLTLLLMLIAEGRLPSKDVVTMIQRLHTPGYEEARLHIDQAIEDGVLEPNLLSGFYWQRDLEDIVRKYAS